MRRKGVDEIFFAGTSLDDMVKFVHRRYGKPRAKRPRPKSAEQELAHKLTEIEDSLCGRKKTSTPTQVEKSKIEIAIANAPSHRFHRAGRRGKNDVD